MSGRLSAGPFARPGARLKDNRLVVDHFSAHPIPSHFITKIINFAASLSLTITLSPKKTRPPKPKTRLDTMCPIVPADTPSIRDLSAAVPPTGRHGGELVRARVIGPHNEGSRIVLECETQGGYPDPSLSWWRNGRLVDDSYEIVSAQDGLVISQVRPSDGGELELAATGEEQSPSSEMDDTQATPKASTSSSSSPSSSSAPRLFRNRLELGPLTRNDLLANYSCEAPNSKLQTEPPSSFVMIDMNRKYLVLYPLSFLAPFSSLFVRCHRIARGRRVSQSINQSARLCLSAKSSSLREKIIKAAALLEKVRYAPLISPD